MGGCIYFFFFFYLKKRKINDKGRGGGVYRGYLCQAWHNVRGGLVIIRDEAWWWGWLGQKRVILAWRNYWAAPGEGGWFKRAFYEIKKSVRRTFDTSRCCRKWFSISYIKRKLRNCEWSLKLLGEKISTYWESWISRIGQNLHLSDVHDRFEVIKIFHLFLYSIEINLFKHVRWDKMWRRTIGALNVNWTMPKILKLQKL